MALKVISKLPPSIKPVKKVDQGPNKGETLSQILSSIRADKGDKVVVRGNTIPVVTRLPTGIFEFDFYIGGGFPNGRYTIVYGPESSGKTNICLKAVAAAQRLPGPCNKAVWLNIEQSFDPLWAAKMGVNVQDLIVVNPAYGEEAVDLVDALVRASDVAILVVDSMASLIANREIANSTEKFDIGSSALLIKRMVNKMMIAFGEESRRNHFPCVLLINQTRFKPGVMFGDPEIMPGGEAQKFLSSLRIRLYAKNVVDKPTNTLVFKDTQAVIKKAKIPVRAVTFSFEFCVHAHDDLKVGDTDSFNMVKSHLQALKILEKRPTGYLVKMAEGLNQMFPTLMAIKEKYMKDEKFQRQLQAMVIDQYHDKLVLVDETDFSPKEVEPGTVVEVQSSAMDEEGSHET